MFTHLRTLGRRFRGPILYIAVYVAAIPAFALIYNAMRHDFYQSTAILDPTYLWRVKELRLELAKRIGAILKPYDSDGSDVIVYASKPRIEELFVREESVLFETEILGPMPPPRDMEELDRTFTTSTLRWKIEKSRQAIGSEQCRFRVGIADVPLKLVQNVPHSADSGGANWGRGLFLRIQRTSQGPVPTADMIGSWLVDCDFARSFETLVRANRGVMLGGPGSYGRFLYFSVVTVTTLGYGDIVPVTDRARAWVAGQSVFGVVVIGLFLNSLGARIAAKSDPRG